MRYLYLTFRPITIVLSLLWLLAALMIPLQPVLCVSPSNHTQLERPGSRCCVELLATGEEKPVIWSSDRPASAVCLVCNDVGASPVMHQRVSRVANVNPVGILPGLHPDAPAVSPPLVAYFPSHEHIKPSFQEELSLTSSLQSQSVLLLC
jgi:hypothetical protein